MRTVTEHLREHTFRSAMRSAGQPYMPTLESLRETEWCPAFETFMRARLVMGAFRHGLIGEPGKPQWDRTGDMRRRVGEYEATGNIELLVDIANVAMLEFVEGRHPLRHFSAGDDKGHASITAER